LDRGADRFQGFLSCYPSLDRVADRFQGLLDQGGRMPADRFMSAIGGL
jgi:hypothetical protein